MKKGGFTMGRSITGLWVVALVALTVLFVASSPCRAAQDTSSLTQSFSEPWAGYEIRYPSGWTYDKPDRVTVVFSGPKNTDDYYTTVSLQNIASVKMGGNHADMPSLLANLKKQFTDMDPQARFFNESAFSFPSEDRTPVTAVTFGVAYIMKGKSYQQWAIVVPRASGLLFHVFFYTSPSELYNRNARTAYDMLATWRLLKENR